MFTSIAMCIFWSMLFLVGLTSSYTLAYTNMNLVDDIGLMAFYLPIIIGVRVKLTRKADKR